MPRAKADRGEVAEPGRQREDAALVEIDQLQRSGGGGLPTLPDAKPAQEGERHRVGGGQGMRAVVEEAELGIAIAAAPSAEVGARFQHRDGMGAVAQPQRREKPGKAAADNEGAADACRPSSDRITHSAAAPRRP